MRIFTSKTGPLSGPYGPGGGPRASTWLGLFGAAWLVFAFLAALCAGDGNYPLSERAKALQSMPQQSLPSRTDIAAAASGQPKAVPALSALSAPSALERQRLQRLVEEVLPQALPLAAIREEPATDAPDGTAAVLLPHAPLQPGGAAVPGTPVASGAPAADTAPGVRRYLISGPCAPLRLGLALLERLRAAFDAGHSATGAQPAVAWTDEGSLEIRVNGRPSHVFRFPGREKALADLARPFPAAALVLVLDDLGQRRDAAEALAALPFPVAFAVWPHAPAAREAADLAGQMGLDCLVHLPMEPLPRAGRRVDPGKGALLTGMSAGQVSDALESGLKLLPTAVGLNNHMGSRFTGDAAACRLLCSQLAGRGLFVLDSVTRPDSKLGREARAAGLVSASRAIFLDSRREQKAVTAALDAAAVAARTRGYAVAVGHPYPETLRALRNWQNNAGTAVLPLRRLIWHLAAAKYADKAGL